jgi:hypothetical protein
VRVARRRECAFQVFDERRYLVSTFCGKNLCSLLKQRDSCLRVFLEFGLIRCIADRVLALTALKFTGPNRDAMKWASRITVKQRVKSSGTATLADELVSYPTGTPQNPVFRFSDTVS